MSERSAPLDADGPNPDQHPASAPLDRVFDILATEYRRQVVVRLDRETGTLPFETLVTSVTAMRTGLEPAALEETDREPTRIALYHSHLPKLVDTGVVEFDRETGTVAPGPRLDVVAASLEAVEKLHAS